MGFDLNVWWDYRKQCSDLSDELKSLQKEGYRLDSPEWNRVADRLQDVMQRCGVWMDSVGVTLPAEKWLYDGNDQRTWRSHRDFEYHHLV